MSIIINLIVSTIAVLATVYILPGVKISGFETAIILAIVLGIINTFIKPVLNLLTLPLTIITLGLFQLILNALLIILATFIVPGFVVDNFWWALLFALVLSIINGFLNTLRKN